MEDRAVLLYKLQSDKLLAVFSVELDCSIPAAVAFAENGEDVVVFGMKDGNVWVAISSSRVLIEASHRHTL